MLRDRPFLLAGIDIDARVFGTHRELMKGAARRRRTTGPWGRIDRPLGPKSFGVAAAVAAERIIKYFSIPQHIFAEDPHSVRGCDFDESYVFVRQCECLFDHVCMSVSMLATALSGTPMRAFICVIGIV